MRKYFFIYKSEVMSSMAYVLNVLLRLVTFCFVIYVFMNLWNYIYDDPDKLINGYSKYQMIWYVIVTEIIWYSLEGRKLCKKITNDVKGGNIAYQINKPYSYIGYAISSHLGEITIKGLISLIVGFTLGLILMKWIPALTFIQALIVFLSGILAILIGSFLVTFIGLISFMIEDSVPIFWIYSKMVLILGTLFPIEFFPGVLSNIIKLTPIYVTCYGPAKLFVDFSYDKAFEIIIYQLIYLAFSSALCFMLFRKGVKKLNVTGG